MNAAITPGGDNWESLAVRATATLESVTDQLQALLDEIRQRRKQEQEEPDAGPES